MRIIGWHLVRLVNEAASDLVGTVVETIQADRDTGRLLFELEARRHRRWLVIDCRGKRQAFFWTSDKKTVSSFGSFQPTERFNRLKGCRLGQVAITQPDRVIHLMFDKPQRQQVEAQQLDLWITWTGAAGNVWLVRPVDVVVLETLWRTRSAAEDAVFSLPKVPPLLNWQTMEFPEYERERSSRPGIILSEFLKKSFWGIDEPIALLIEKETEPFQGRPDRTWREFSSMMHLLRAAVDPSTPVLVSGEGKGAPAIVPYAGQTGEEGASHFDSLASALTALDGRSGEEGDRAAVIAKLLREVQDRSQRLRYRIAETETAIADGQTSAQIRRNADLLGAQREALRPGMREISLTDWESGVEIAIPLDPALPPQENIDSLYRRASKAVRAARNAREVLPSLQHELGIWETRLRLFENPSISEEEVDRIRAACGLGRPDARPNKHASPKRLPYREFRVGSYVVLVGRSSRDNDQLTLRTARPHDLFLHASQSGGAHVILRRESRDREFDHQTIIAAAQVAAFFSKAKHSGLVSVSYTEVRHVRKPRKAPPGLVQVTKEKSVMVRPLPPVGYHDGGYNE